jgi:hypothetical protein
MGNEMPNQSPFKAPFSDKSAVIFLAIVTLFLVAGGCRLLYAALFLHVTEAKSTGLIGVLALGMAVRFTNALVTYFKE